MMGEYPAETPRIETACGWVYVIKNYENDKVSAIRPILGKSGGCVHCSMEAFSRMAKLALQYGASVEEIKMELMALRCDKVLFKKDSNVLSCYDAISKVL